MIQCQGNGPVDPCVRSHAREFDRQVCCSQWQGSLQDCSAYGYQQVVAKVCNSAADKNMAWIKKVNQACQHIADHLSTLANNIQCRLIPLAAGSLDVLRQHDSAI